MLFLLIHLKFETDAETAGKNFKTKVEEAAEILKEGAEGAAARVDEAVLRVHAIALSNKLRLLSARPTTPSQILDELTGTTSENRGGIGV